MAPRRQAKHAEMVTAVDADGGGATPAKRKKTVTIKTAEEPKPARAGPRQTKIEKYEDTTAGDASPAKKSRAKAKTAAPKTVEPKSKFGKGKKPVEDNSMQEEKVVEKRSRAAKPAAAKKAGTKELMIAAKPKTKAAPARKAKNIATEDSGKDDMGNTKKDTSENPAKRTRGKVVGKESVTPTARAAAKTKTTSRKRKNTESATEIVATVAEPGDTQIADTIPDKRIRGRVNKTETETNDESAPKSKARAKKDAAKANILKLSNEIEAEEHNHNATDQDYIDPKGSKKAGAQKGNLKKTASTRGKRNTAAGKTNGTQAEETAISETDINENGKAESVQMAEPKQKKRNTGKTNAVIMEKTEAKGRQKKGQAVTPPMNEKEMAKDVIAENNITKTMNSTSETQNMNNINIKNFSANKIDTNLHEELEEEQNENDMGQDKSLRSSLESVEGIKDASLNNEAGTP